MKKNVFEQVTRVLLADGIPENVQGYYYLRDAICECVLDKLAIRCVVKGIYLPLAEIYDTTHSRVERAMRAAIEHHSLNFSELTNSHYIAKMADVIRINNMEEIDK